MTRSLAGTEAGHYWPTSPRRNRFPITPRIGYAAGMARRPMLRIDSLAPRAHAVYRLAPELLLVFKPRGHDESTHAHAHRQQLRILRGRLRVATARGEVVLTPASRAYTLAAGRAHSTRALSDTWLIARIPTPTLKTHPIPPLNKGGQGGFSE